MATHAETDFPALHREASEIWERNSRWWDEHMGEGNRWHLELIAPAAERLLDIQPGERVLELACGNGQFARRLAQLGARVMACDGSPSMLDCARLRSSGNADRIEYRLVDLMSEEQLATLGRSQFDAAVCNMALMDIAGIQPLLRAVCRALEPGGRFVFTIPHPCFNTSGCTILGERDDSRSDENVSCSIRVTRYRTLGPEKGFAMKGQPVLHYYFHRTLSALLSACFAAGFVLEGLEEPAFQEPPEQPFTVRWQNCPEIPPVLAGRLRAYCSSTVEKK